MTQRMSQKKIMPEGTYSAGGVPSSIIRTPNPTANTTDAATKYVLLQQGTLIEANTTNAYLANITTPSGGTSISGLQTMDYQYHIRGMLNCINCTTELVPTPNTSQGDLFSYKLEYETAAYWDGNIGKQIWHNGTDSRNYVYTYDKASRLKSATYTGVNGEDYSLPNINYDLNGNITHLQRKGKVGSGFALMDNLTYTHVGNRLSQVTDAISGNNEVDFVPRGSGSYTYYNDGSLKSDANEQIQTIIYDRYLQQPIEIQLTDDRKINHYYDGSGSLLKTVYSTGQVWEYTTGLIYKNGVPFQITTPEGRAVYQGGSWSLEFFYQDHLGNSRTGFKANGNQLEKISETSFDPWGVVLRQLGPMNPVENRFEMQGKEKENTFGLNRINFGARTLNPTTGVLDRVDNFANMFDNLTPYNYALNNPLLYVDPTGDSSINVNNLNMRTFDVNKDEVQLPVVTVSSKNSSSSSLLTSSGTQVMSPVSGFWGWTGQFWNGNRTYWDGREVNSDGFLLSTMKPVMGSPPDGGIMKVGQIAKAGLAFNKGILESFTKHAFAGGRHSDLGLSVETMASKGLDLIEQNMSLLKAGDNTLIGNINGIQKSFKAFVKDGKIMSVNMYPGVSSRVTQGTVINFGDILW